MSIFERRYLFVLSAALAVILAGCESTEKKHVSTAPPPAATAPTLAAAVPQAPPQKIEEKIAPKPDPVEEMLRGVEREYQAGRANYSAGHLEAAKDAFNRAFELLLNGPVNVHADPRLEAEFDKVVEGVHSLEMQALKAGDGFTEQMAQPAPIDEANDVTFPVDPKIKALAAAEVKETHSDLPLVLNDEVASYINYFSSPRGHGVLERALTRAGRYRDMILRVLKEEGVPQDLIYLAEAESGFQPVALSRAGARGMWQFIASRGVAYGLRHDWWVDDRQDPEKSTRAAAKHLKDLYTQFGDWYLAMAAYNSGPGTVQAAVQRTGYADFWELYRRRVLPQETKNYVPIILAVTIMAKNPKQYGLADIQPDPQAESDTVTINYPADLRLVAECVDTSVSSLQELNPSLLRMTTPKTGDFDLHLPAGTKDKFLTAVAEIPTDMRVWWRYHKVSDGDTLASLARQYHTTATAITEVNNLGAGEDLPRDTKLIIPITPGEMKEGSGISYSKAVVRYKVRQGDTVLSVADEWGVAPEMVRKWNRLRGNDLRRGRILLIHRPVTDGARVSGASTKRVATRKSSRSKTLRASAQKAAKRITHTVKKGETLTSIASRYNTSVAALRRENSRAATHLKPGDVIIISSVR